MATTGCVGLLALIAGTASYLHMHTRVAVHGQPGWVAALTPLSVDGMIVAASTTFAGGFACRSARWAAARDLTGGGQHGEPAVNVAVAAPTVACRVIAAMAELCPDRLL
jgi:hypothetical protein